MALLRKAKLALAFGFGVGVLASFKSFNCVSNSEFTRNSENVVFGYGLSALVGTASGFLAGCGLGGFLWVLGDTIEQRRFKRELIRAGYIHVESEEVTYYTDSYTDSNGPQSYMRHYLVKRDTDGKEIDRIPYRDRYEGLMSGEGPQLK